MRKKTRKQKPNRRQSAARRARKEKERSTGRRSPRSAQRYVATTRPDGTSIVKAVRASELGTNIAYMGAHGLLPPGYPSSDADVRAHAPWAHRILEDPLSPAASVLRAIMVLGHTPDERALAALRRHVSRNGVHADMAELAADECEWWIEGTDSTPLDPEHLCQPNPMLN